MILKWHSKYIDIDKISMIDSNGVDEPVNSGQWPHEFYVYLGNEKITLHIATTSGDPVHTENRNLEIQSARELIKTFATKINNQ